MCCGVDLRTEDLERFIRELARIFNRRNPNAYFLLEGTQGQNAATIPLWEAAIRRVSADYPELLIQIERKDESVRKGLFRGFSIRLR